MYMYMYMYVHVHMQQLIIHLRLFGSVPKSECYIHVDGTSRDILYVHVHVHVYYRSIHVHVHDTNHHVVPKSTCTSICNYRQHCLDLHVHVVTCRFPNEK